MSEPIKKEENKILKKYSIEEVKNMVVKQARTVDDLNSIYRELGNEILPKYFDGNEEDKKEVEEKLNSRVTQVMMTLETETHLGVMETFDPTYREMSKELCSKIIKENNCDSSLEKTLVEVIVISFIRIIDNSRRLNNILNHKEITHEKNTYIQNLSKQTDRANRQYLNAVMTLRQLKSPTIEMNIKTNTAFISQNQQINSNDKNNDIK